MADIDSYPLLAAARVASFRVLFDRQLFVHVSSLDLLILSLTVSAEGNRPLYCCADLRDVPALALGGACI
jgi:hypothetical protein